MARPLRVEYQNAYYFVTSKGNASQRVFISSDDGKLWMNTFESVCSRFGWICHAYCLMGNHYHIVVETPKANLSAGMRQLNGVYTQAFNRKHNRSGHLFTGRFNSVIFQKEKYLKRVIRHTLSNPVRKGLITSPVQWKWSSCRASSGKESVSFINPLAISSIFGGGTEFEKFISTPEQNSIRSEIKNQIYLGDRDFIERSSKFASVKHSKEIPAEQRMTLKSVKRFVSGITDRNEAVFAAYRSGEFSMKEISDHFGIHYSTVSRIVSEHENSFSEFRKTG
ncbi:MAG: addiction module toxin RelE [Candidatus Mycalebacterium zealandia]|nr:MAG: addiction module toxin RelE [Candidatus Mycalebacterium zealandia]